MIARALIAILAALAPALVRAESASCLINDATQWPARPKPYVFVIADSSGSMTTSVSPATPNSCNFGAGSSSRLDHERCALRTLFQTYSGDVTFAFSTFATQQNSTCSTTFVYPSDSGGLGCGPRPGVASTRAGLSIRVPIARDERGTGGAADARNEAASEGWVNGACDNGAELYAFGNDPLNGALRDAARYFSATGWTAPDGSTTFATPLSGNDPVCRSLNVILITDSDENCDTQADAVAAAQALFATGVTVGGKTFRPRVFVVNFAGATAANMDAIAAAGGTSTSSFVTNETTLSSTLNTIINSLLKPELCDNADNDCNLCTDEGYVHYANIGQTCCAWGTAPQRNTCLTNYQASITPANPQGNRALLPCTTLAQQSDPLGWLCYNPGETCDNVDNNADGQVDEGFVKCGSPLHCPTGEVCNGQDDDCDGVVDNGICAGGSWSPEICDGCDNDYDGIADDNVAPEPCGLPMPANCAGTRTCKAAQPVTPGGCVAGGGWNPCGNSPQSEGTACDGVDNASNGVADDAVTPAACVPAGTPSGLVYGGTSQCRMGTQGCGQPACVGFVGPTPEVTDGVDNDCDGVLEPFVFANGFE
jgi:hypothetical protein